MSRTEDNHSTSATLQRSLSAGGKVIAVRSEVDQHTVEGWPSSSLEPRGDTWDIQTGQNMTGEWRIRYTRAKELLSFEPDDHGAMQAIQSANHVVGIQLHARGTHFTWKHELP